MTGSPEYEPRMSVEAQVLTELGLEHLLDQPLSGSNVTGRNFLDVYTKPEKRQQTEDLLEGFLADPQNPDNRALIGQFIQAYTGHTPTR